MESSSQSPTLQSRAEEAAQVARSTIADPAPLGLAAFALTTFVLSMYNAQFLSANGLPVVLGLAVAYGGLVQLTAGMWEFRRGNTFGAVAFSSFGGFWLSYFVLALFLAPTIPSSARGASIGVFLLGWGVFTAYMFIASLRTTVAIALVFLALAATFFVLGIGNWSYSSPINNTVKIGGYLGVLTAVFAWYASFASVTNSTFGKTILPVVPLRR